MKKFNAERVSWDSDFFHFEVYKITLNELKEQSSLKSLQPNLLKFTLCYILSSYKLLNDIEAFEDEKVVFEIDLGEDVGQMVDSIILADASHFDNLLGLALASGEYSRFRLDPRFKNQEFERMYSEWLLKSLNRTIADEVFIYRIENTIAGFVTVKKKAGFVDIGLIATNKSFRGQGIGTSLLGAVFQYAVSQGFRKVQVATQRRNLLAINFYIKNGFTECENTFIYHLWK